MSSATHPPRRASLGCLRTAICSSTALAKPRSLGAEHTCLEKDVSPQSVTSVTCGDYQYVGSRRKPVDLEGIDVLRLTVDSPTCSAVAGQCVGSGGRGTAVAMVS